MWTRCCDHAYHEGCLHEWLRQRRHSCPTCRKDIFSTDLAKEPKLVRKVLSVKVNDVVRGAFLLGGNTRVETDARIVSIESELIRSAKPTRVYWIELKEHGFCTKVDSRELLLSIQRL